MGNYICPAWVDYSNELTKGLLAATGGLIGSNAVVCGGEDSAGINGFRNEVLAKKLIICIISLRSSCLVVLSTYIHFK